MSLNSKRIIVGLLSLTFLVSLLIVAWVEGLKKKVSPEPEPVLVGVNQTCYECHKVKTPSTTAMWNDSRHARMGVGCYDCHKAKKGDVDAWHHEGKLISTLVTPGDCGQCHKDIAAEFQGSHHAKAGRILGSLDNILGEIVEGTPAANSGCQQCHGSKLALKKDAAGKVVRDKSGKPTIDNRTWPNSGIGRINLDGTIGTCSACHSRHTFSIEMARRPDNCGKCHLGPDHPQKEIYDESKHGIAFVTADQQGKMHLTKKPWIVGETYYAAPTCATCHMSATRNQKATHAPGKRISWTLRPKISKHQKNWKEKRRSMKDVCSSCHTQDWVDGHYAQYDRAVGLYNDKFAKPGARIMAALKKAKLVTQVPFDDKIEWTWFFLWHHEGRRARMGASMMAPDYTQWHGFFEVADRFYNELVPEAKELAHGNAEVQKVIASVMDMPQHAWKKGLNKDLAKSVREYYKRRYGHGAGKPTPGAPPPAATPPRVAPTPAPPAKAPPAKMPPAKAPPAKAPPAKAPPEKAGH